MAGRVRVAWGAALLFAWVLAAGAQPPGIAGASPAKAPPTILNTQGRMGAGSGRPHIATTGYPKPTLSLTGTLPNGISYTSANGRLSFIGTPAATTGGLYHLTVTATNTSGTISAPYTLTVVQLPTFSKDKNFCPSTLTIGTYVHLQQFIADWPPDHGLTTTGLLPTGLHFVQSTTKVSGLLLGTPVAADAGRAALKYSADNADASRIRYKRCTLRIDEAPSFTGNLALAPLGVSTINGFAVVTAGQLIYPPIKFGGDAGYPRASPPTVTLPEPIPGVTFTGFGGFANGHANFRVRIHGRPNAGSEGVYLVDVTLKNTVATATEGFVLIVKASSSTRKATAVTLTASSVTTTFTHGVTLTATVSGNSPAGGYVQFMLEGANAPVTVPVTKTGTLWVASYTTPATVAAGTYDVAATYTGNTTTTSSTAATVLHVIAAPTSLSLSPSSESVAPGAPATFTARVTSSAGVPQGEVVFTVGAKQVGVDLNATGIATFTTTPTLDTSEDPYTVHAKYMPYEYAPTDWGDSTATATLTVGEVTLSADASSSPTNVVAIADHGTVTVTPSMPLELSVHLSTGATPPAPVTLAMRATGATCDSALGLTASETEPASDPDTGKTDFLWSVPASKLTTLSSHSLTVQVRSSSSLKDLPASFTFTLTW